MDRRRVCEHEANFDVKEHKSKRNTGNFEDIIVLLTCPSNECIRIIHIRFDTIHPCKRASDGI